MREVYGRDENYVQTNYLSLDSTFSVGSLSSEAELRLVACSTRKAFLTVDLSFHLRKRFDGLTSFEMCACLVSGS